MNLQCIDVVSRLCVRHRKSSLFAAEWNSIYLDSPVTGCSKKWKYGTKISFFLCSLCSPVEYCVSDIYGFFMLNLVKLESSDRLLCCHIYLEQRRLALLFELWLMHSLNALLELIVLWCSKQLWCSAKNSWTWNYIFRFQCFSLWGFGGF